MASGGIYLAAEFIAAAAWTDPPYSYTHHFTSNLGVRGPVTAFGQFMHSPLAWVMNTGFFLFGLIGPASVVALKELPAGRRLPAVVMAALLPVGSVLLRIFEIQLAVEIPGAKHVDRATRSNGASLSVHSGASTTTSAVDPAPP